MFISKETVFYTKKYLKVPYENPPRTNAIQTMQVIEANFVFTKNYFSRQILIIVLLLLSLTYKYYYFAMFIYSINFWKKEKSGFT